MAADLAARLTEALSSQADVEVAYLFGSRSRGEARPDSDIDVAALFQGYPAVSVLAGRVLAVERVLMETLGTGRIHLSQLNRTDALFLHEVLTGGCLIWEEYPGAKARLLSRASARYWDTAKFRRAASEALRDAW